MRPMAPKADLRPFQMAALSASDSRHREVFGLNGLAIAVMRVEQVVDLLVRAFDLDDQQRLDVERIAGMGEGLADLDRRPVHELDGDRNDAGADDGGDAVARRLAGVEADQHRPRALGGAQDAHGRLGDDAELALRADDQAEEVVAGAVEMRAADLDDGAVDQHHLDAEHVVGGDAVLQAMGAAGVHGDVAGDGAGELARRIGRVEEALVRDRLADAEVGDAGLDAGGAVLEVDLEHAVHLGDAEDDRVLRRDRAARERGAGAARHDLEPCSWQKRSTADDLLGRRRQHDRQRQPAVGGQRVGLVGAALVLRGHESLGRDKAGEAGDDLVAAGEDALDRAWGMRSSWVFLHAAL